MIQPVASNEELLSAFGGALPATAEEMAIGIHQALVSHIAPHIKEDCGGGVLVAATVEAISIIFERVGGSNVYLPTLTRAKAQARDTAIYAEFNGSNIQALAKKYDLSEPHIRRILRSKRVKRVAARANQLQPVQKSCSLCK